MPGSMQVTPSSYVLMGSIMPMGTLIHLQSAQKAWEALPQDSSPSSSSVRSLTRLSYRMPLKPVQAVRRGEKAPLA